MTSSLRVMNNHAGLTFDSAYRNHVFIYKRSIKLLLGEGCLGYNKALNVCGKISEHIFAPKIEAIVYVFIQEFRAYQLTNRKRMFTHLIRK